MKRNSLSKENLVQLANDTINGHETQKSVHECQTPLKMRSIAAQTNLSSSSQRLLKQIPDEPNEMFHFSSREMERRNEVNPATISRTIQAIIYQKFVALARSKNYFVPPFTPYSSINEQFEGQVLFEFFGVFNRKNPAAGTLPFNHSDKQDRVCPFTKDSQDLELNSNPRFASSS